MLDRGERLDDRGEPPRREHQRIAAGEDHLPDFGMGADIVERRGELHARQRAPAPDHLAAEAEAAIDRADMDRLEQHAVGIAVHDALDRTMRVVADRVGVLLRPRLELGAIRHELARDRIARVGGIDEVHDIRGQRQGIAGDNLLELGPAVARGKPGGDQIIGAAQRLRRLMSEFLVATARRLIVLPLMMRKPPKCQSAPAADANFCVGAKRAGPPRAERRATLPRPERLPLALRAAGIQCWLRPDGARVSGV